MDYAEILDSIDPAALTYGEWVSVGMALRHEGLPCSAWDEWSSRDTGRYHAGECERKWSSFLGSDTPVTGGTLVELARRCGWQPSSGIGHELGWNDAIGGDRRTDGDRTADRGIKAPAEWDPARELITYLDTLFEPDENVGYVTRVTVGAGDKASPTKGCWDRTAGQLIGQLERCKGDIGAVLGDYDPEHGAWIRFNPLDGNGVRNENVTKYRYALVESDSVDIEKQYAIIKELELPVACLVHSGNRSLHAIVHIDAPSYQEYRRRVDFLYNVCRRNGLDIDVQNRNPSRLSRMPGVMRGENRQFLLGTNIGKASWAEWSEWIEDAGDDLPDPEALAAVWNDMPELAPALIDGVLRQGHKLLLAGPSKAGKSFALIELCISIAEGRPWLGFGCAQGRVMYVNLELDRASCLHRFADVYRALGWAPDNITNIDIWNLRGRSVPMDRLAPKLIRKAARKNYIAIVIDPIYKIITGDENSADQMARFCNQFDKVCTELGCAVIYCHHHSKGAQGQKRSMDRASGSGVFARDPDALLDLIELEQPQSMIEQDEKRRICRRCLDWLGRFEPEAVGELEQDDRYDSKKLLSLCRDKLSPQSVRLLMCEVENERKAAQMRTAWRIEATLREFPKFPPVNMWFDYPIHTIDGGDLLKTAQADVDVPAWKKASDARKKSSEIRSDSNREKFMTALDACSIDGEPTVKALAEYFSDADGNAKAQTTLYRWIKKYGFHVDKNTGVIVKNNDGGAVS